MTRLRRLCKCLWLELSWATVFPYDATLLASVETAPQTVADVLWLLEDIQTVCAAGDGLRWFNGLYLQVTQAVQARAALQGTGSGGFADPAWIASLDVVFANFYFAAVKSSLSGEATPGCWQAMFAVRNDPAIARIQFAMAGMNAHINHDLPQAVVAACRGSGAPPQHGTAHYSDFTAINATLDGLIDAAKETLNVRLLGDALPPVSRLEDTLAAWSVSAARESAWNNAELMWNLAGAPLISATFLDTLDGFTAVGSKALLVPVP
jgi:Family of unknown function (DUF5995)